MGFLNILKSYETVQHEREKRRSSSPDSTFLPLANSASQQPSRTFIHPGSIFSRRITKNFSSNCSPMHASKKSIELVASLSVPQHSPPLSASVELKENFIPDSLSYEQCLRIISTLVDRSVIVPSRDIDPLFTVSRFSLILIYFFCESIPFMRLLVEEQLIDLYVDFSASTVVAPAIFFSFRKKCSSRHNRKD